MKRLARRQDTQALRELLTADAARLRQGMAPNGPDRCLAAVYPEKTTALDYLPENALVCVEESGRTAEALRGWLWQLKEDVSAGMEAGFLAGELADFAASEQELAARLEKRLTVQLDSLTTGRQLLAPRDLLQLTAKQLSSYGGSLELACTDLTHYLTSGYRVMVLCGGEVRARNLQQMLADRKIPAAVDLTGEKAPEKGTVLIAVGALSAGCEYPEGRLAVLTEGQLTTPLSGRSKKPRPKRDSNQQKLQSYTDLTPGDLVVHAHHGIGRFVAMLRLPVDGVEKDYIKIAYAGQDVLYVPATSLDLVSKYIGPGEDNERTKLNKLGGAEWAKTTRKAKAAAKDLAEGLIRLYAQRQRLAGHAFSPDSPWQQEFEDAFPYTETDDQLQAIRDIKADMEQPRPMDRLVCGDVGFGKTEVAIRAAFKAAVDGKQVAGLVLFYDTFNWIYAYITWDERINARTLQILRCDYKDFTYGSKAIPLPDGEISLKVCVNGAEAQFCSGQSAIGSPWAVFSPPTTSAMIMSRPAAGGAPSPARWSASARRTWTPTKATRILPFLTMRNSDEKQNTLA